MISATTLQWVIASSFILPSLGKLYNNPSQLTKTTYDYIVVGGELVVTYIREPIIDSYLSTAGAAGPVVAARLSEDPSVSVLLVEAGISYVINFLHLKRPNPMFVGMRESNQFPSHFWVHLLRQTPSWTGILLLHLRLVTIIA